MMNDRPFLIALLVLFMTLIVWSRYHGYEISKQQRQDDQVCEGVFQLAMEQGAREQSGFTGGREYCPFMADFTNHRALLGEFDGKICPAKKPQLIIMNSVPDGLLREWVEQPVIYGRYKKIR